MSPFMLTRCYFHRVNEQDHERVVDPEAGVIEGEDDFPREPAPPLDPYTPEPGPRPGEQRAFSWLRWAWFPVVIGILLVLYAALR
jgi:hypothetical protein